MTRFLIVLAFLLGLIEPVYGQATVKQSGNVTQGHAAAWVSPGVIRDAGPAAQGFLNTLGITGSGPVFCINSGPTTGAYNQFCLGATQGGGGTISLFGINGASGGLTINVNGSQITFPFIVPATGILGPNSTATGNTMCWNNTVGTLASDCGFGDARSWGGTSGGSANAQTLTISNYSGTVAGTAIRFKAGFTNTASTNLNINSAGAILIEKQTVGGLVQLTAGDIVVGQVYSAVFDGSVWQLIGAAVTNLQIQSFTAAHVVATTECNQFQVYSGGFFGITLNSPATYPTGCQVTLQNADVGRGKYLSIAGVGSIRFPPNTTVTFTNNGSAWIQSPQNLFWDASTFTFYFAVAGSDNVTVADCLSSLSPCATAQAIIDMSAAFATTSTGGYNIQFNCDAHYVQGVFIARTGQKIINFIGNPGSPQNCIFDGSNGTNVFDVQDGAQVTIDGFQVGFPIGSGKAFNGRQLVILDVSNIFFANNTGGVNVNATDLASVNVFSPTLGGNSVAFIGADANSAVTINGTITVPALVNANIGILYDAVTANIQGTPVYSISGTITGQQFACGDNAVISIGAAYPAALTAGSSNTGCQHTP
jgi:hypothetical protein